MSNCVQSYNSKIFEHLDSLLFSQLLKAYHKKVPDFCKRIYNCNNWIFTCGKLDLKNRSKILVVSIYQKTVACIFSRSSSKLNYKIYNKIIHLSEAE